MTIYDYIGGKEMVRAKDAVGAIFVTATKGTYRIVDLPSAGIKIVNANRDDDYTVLFFRSNGELYVRGSDLPAAWNAVMTDQVHPRATVKRLFE